MLYETTWRSKGLTDGAETIDEMIGKLQSTVEELKQMRDAGITLEGCVGDDYGTLVTEDPEVAKQFGLEEWEDPEEEEEENDEPWIG